MAFAVMAPIAISSTSLWSVVCLATLLYAIRWRRKHFHQLPLPPGPKKLPIVGNLFDIPADLPWEAYQQWSKDFKSDIIHLNVAGTSIIVLSSMEVIKDLLDRRSALYSDRPHAPMLNDLMGWSEFFGFMNHGDRWRRQRKLFHEAFHAGAVKQFNPQVRNSTHRLLRRLLKDPHNLMAQFRHLAGALIMEVTYGLEVESTEDPYIQIAEEAMHGLGIACIPGTFLVDLIPALKYVPSWFPGADFKRKARRWRDVTRELVEFPFAETKRRMAAGTAPLSFASLNLSLLTDSGSKQSAGSEERDIKETSAAAYAAGADTTVSAMGTFALAMLKHPDVQRKAQAELDAVIGHGHLPELGDAPALPYVSAIVKEVLRWENVAPIGIPHRILVEDEYRGYRIPANSIVIGNVWALMHNEEIYPDPKSFKPERFLLDGKLNSNMQDPEVVFGFGRRICPGRHIAYSSLWLTMASILATFDIDKAVDGNGNVVEPSYEYSSALVFAPLPFECSITPRSSQAVQAIEAAVGAG
ncbi:cytochrome P450 [Mycena alexandri]|uniref:Cytochrome P450 n=1 Tax=Mycena alexandri TaxID=1745969 RepID=A0AAD6S586_9AGAR|nr:cytochrome P450 [Mycena alexandri]